MILVVYTQWCRVRSAPGNELWPGNKVGPWNKLGPCNKMGPENKLGPPFSIYIYIYMLPVADCPKEGQLILELAWAREEGARSQGAASGTGEEGELILCQVHGVNRKS